MSNIPNNLRYTTEHAWIDTSGEHWRVGITDFASNRLADITFVEVTEVGRRRERGESFAVVESVKTAMDLFMPVSGTLRATNTDLEVDPELVNEDPYGDGWIVEITPSDRGEVEKLLTPEAYAKLCAQEGD